MGTKKASQRTHGRIQAALKGRGKTGKGFDPQNPLFFSVRSGAAISMPGMMDTILNLGLNNETIEGVNPDHLRWKVGYYAYRRFISSSVRLPWNR
jgi:phosphoenolpyruvate synthase/pyruvate phosphate dikinase